MSCRFLSATLALAAASWFPPGVHAQIHPGLHVARAADSFGGVNGVGGSLQLNLPVRPVDLFFAGEYFFPACDDCSHWGGSADIHLSLVRRVWSPYGAAGLVLRSSDASDTSVRTGGFGLGVGVNLATRVAGGFAEARYEVMAGGVDQFVFRLGVRPLRRRIR